MKMKLQEYWKTWYKSFEFTTKRTKLMNLKGF